MGFWDWSTTAASNVTVGGIDIGENCPAGNLNGAQREQMAELRQAFNAALQSFLSASDLATARAALGAFSSGGGSITGDITRSGAGLYPYFADPAYTTPKIIVLGPTDPDPGTLTPGMILVTLT